MMRGMIALRLRQLPARERRSRRSRYAVAAIRCGPGMGRKLARQDTSHKQAPATPKRQTEHDPALASWSE